MKKPRKSEKLLLEEIFESSKALKKAQRGISIGEIISLIRSQLRMSQRVLAKKANVPQSTISRIESNSFEPNVITLRKITDALECDLLITISPCEEIGLMRIKQASIKASKKIQYLQGTMSLEDQEPDQKILNELIEDETKSLLDSSSSELWEE